jgi:putative nucleotidyltransferase with HDIG domain
MHRLVLISDRPAAVQGLVQELSQLFEVDCVPLHATSETEPGDFNIIDVHLARAGISDLQLWLRRKPRAAPAVFAVDEHSEQETVQAFSMGASDVMPRPLQARALAGKFLGDIAALAAPECLPGSEALSAGVVALQDIFASARLGAPLQPQAIESAGEAVAAQIEADGLGEWVGAVRHHHSQTYQHCLIVTGVAVSFGQCLGFASNDLRRLATAGLLHDVGKSRIPLSILEKPGPLSSDELEVMRQHPVFGYEALRALPGLSPEMLDVVVHHHESLDGSGYPHGLQGDEISDLVRVMTVADIFGALIERRSYKPPMAGEAAYQILLKMGPKLDQDIVRAFKPIAAVRFLDGEALRSSA